jgi:hypothetical protein
MDMTQYGGGSYFKVEDVIDGPRRLRITSVDINVFKRPELGFDGTDATLTVNVTNTNTLLKHYGKEHEDWLDKEVELYAGKVPFEGKPVDALLLRPISPAVPFKEREQPPPAKSGPGPVDKDVPF